MRDRFFGPSADLLEKRPVQLAYVGLVVTRWAYVEQAMAFFYDYLLAQKEEKREFGWPVDGLGVASFAAVYSINTKIELLSLAIEWRLGEDVRVEFRNTAAKKVSEAAKERNAVAHGLAEVHDDKPDSLVFEGKRGDPVYNNERFIVVLEKIAEAHEAVTQFHNIRARSILQT